MMLYSFFSSYQANEKRWRRSEENTIWTQTYADFTKAFYFEIYASYQGRGAVLSQDSKDGRMPVVYAS